MFLTLCSPRSSNVDVEPVADLIAHRRRDADAAGVRHRFQPRRDVHAVAKNVVVLDDHVAEIDADAKDQAAARGGTSSFRRAICR